MEHQRTHIHTELSELTPNSSPPFIFTAHDIVYGGKMMLLCLEKQKTKTKKQMSLSKPITLC